ncbi:hypothetical protein X777_04270 [Ooceraea biroi]|uniref:Uncharacterized protein n=1 Tax=Ooceraea biroi TaxID=2015173 RepID=A0A026WIJ1_OOCBI|nr:hypothetical protein X777_04270 [Ooceraea biroi]
MVQGKPKYLRERGNKGSKKIIARWRCGNEEERNRFWAGEGGRNCQICGKEEGAIEHILTHVEKENRFRVRELLGEEGNLGKIKCMREIERLREDAKKEKVNEGMNG